MTTDTLPRDEPDGRNKPSVVLVSPASGALWCVGWLFTIGFAHLGWWKALLALILWPYFLGAAVR